MECVVLVFVVVDYDEDDDNLIKLDAIVSQSMHTVHCTVADIPQAHRELHSTKTTLHTQHRHNFIASDAISYLLEVQMMIAAESCYVFVTVLKIVLTISI